MNDFNKPLADLDGLISELNTVSSNIAMLTALIENNLPNRVTFCEALNATGSHIDRIEKDASEILQQLLELTRSEREESKSQVVNIIQP